MVMVYGSENVYIKHTMLNQLMLVQVQGQV
jgi:hypothetical protein